MKPSKRLMTAAAAALAYYGIRFAIKAGKEWVRYDKMREMSNEPPVASEIPKIGAEIFSQEQDAAAEFAQFIFKVPLEIARYFKIESM